MKLKCLVCPAWVSAQVPMLCCCPINEETSIPLLLHVLQIPLHSSHPKHPLLSFSQLSRIHGCCSPQ
ncbi:hypothetical protein Peur_005163 [Populus x canadensis]